jgi:hypothetical protein
MSTIRYFRDEYEAHIKDKYCPSHVCKPLLKFSVMETAKSAVCVKRPARLMQLSGKRDNWQ